FGLTEIRIGLWPFLIYRAVVDAIGERRALELGITGRIIGARDAAAMGLAHHVTPAAELMDHAGEIASAVAASSPTALRSGLRFVAESRGIDRDTAGQVARRYREELFQTPDFAE